MKFGQLFYILFYLNVFITIKTFSTSKNLAFPNKVRFVKLAHDVHRNKSFLSKRNRSKLLSTVSIQPLKMSPVDPILMPIDGGGGGGSMSSNENSQEMENEEMEDFRLKVWRNKNLAKEIVKKNIRRIRLAQLRANNAILNGWIVRLPQLILAIKQGVQITTGSTAFSYTSRTRLLQLKIGIKYLKEEHQKTIGQLNQIRERFMDEKFITI